MNDKLARYEEYKRAYYLGSPLISDDEFDAFEQSLIDDGIIKDFRVGFKSDAKVTHKTRMTSLQKTREASDLLKLNSKLVVSLKYDGNAVSLLFNHDSKDNVAIKPYKMVTRGDGIKGHDISNRIAYNDSLLCYFNDDQTGEIEVRGEMIITTSNFDLLNNDLIALGLQPMTSKRNAVAGLMNPYRKENISLIKYCTFVPYECMGIDFVDEYDKLNKLSGMFNCKQIESVELIDCKIDMIQYLIDSYKVLIEHDSFDFMTDGLVFTVNEFKEQERLGAKDNYPNYKMAYKLINESAVSTITGFKYDVGVTGKISIVAELKPIELADSVIRNVTCYNKRFIEDNNLKIGRVVTIIRSGEIIPKIVNVIYTPDDGESIDITHCPECGNELIESDTGVDLLCTNYHCKGRAIKRIVQFLSKLDIKDISIKTIEKIYENCEDISDFYDFRASLNRENLLNIHGLSFKTVNNILTQLRQANEVRLSDIISIVIPNIGSKTAEKLVSYIDNDLDSSKLQTMTDVLGVITSRTILDYIDKVKHAVKRLKDSGYVITSMITLNNIDSKKFLITGKLSKNRSDIERLIVQSGNVVDSGVHKDTILVCNDANSNSSKMKKAKDFGCQIITEDELIEMLKK